MTTDVNKHFLEKRTHIVKEIMKKYLTSVVIREMPTEALIIYLYPFI